MLDPKEERDAKKLRELAGRLHIPMPETFWKLEVFKDGQLIQKHHQRSHSWTRNAYNHLFCEMASKNGSDNTFVGGKLSTKNTAGIVKFGASGISHHPNDSIDIANASDGILTPAAQSSKGIVVGSGINAESFEDFALQTQIAEGVGAGQLNYVASNLHDIGYAALVLTDEQIRYFNNNSGGNVDINEVGIIDGWSIIGVPWVLALIVRDHLGAVVTVPDTGQLKVTYTIQLTYPA